MPNIYDIDFGVLTQVLLPPKFRKPRWIAWLKSLVTPLQWTKDNTFDKFRFGWDDALAQKYDTIITYHIDDLVLFRNKVYVCIKTTTAGIDPTNTTYWFKILDDWVGADERIMYCGQTLTLTYLLNRHFGLTFRQPNGVSDIHLENSINQPSLFKIGFDESESSLISIEGILVGSYIGDGTLPNDYTFKVYYPVADIPTGSDLFKELKGLVEKYKLYSSIPVYLPY